MSRLRGRYPFDRLYDPRPDDAEQTGAPQRLDPVEGSHPVGVACTRVHRWTLTLREAMHARAQQVDARMHGPTRTEERRSSPRGLLRPRLLRTRPSLPRGAT